jgi:hypothetical protein
MDILIITVVALLYWGVTAMMIRRDRKLGR